MAFLLRTFSVFIFCIASLAMLFSVFFSSQISQEDSLDILFFEDYSLDTDGDYSYYYISQRESYYSELSGDDVGQIITEGNDFSLTLSKKDRILTSFYDPLKNYTLSAPGIKVEQQGIGEIYIDMLTRSNRYFIQPLTTSLRLSFMSEDGDEVYNSIYLFPGQYIIFDPARSSFYRNADIARMQILTNIGHISNFGDIPESLGVYVGNDTSYIVYQDSIAKKRKYYAQKIQELRSLEISNITGFQRLERYFMLLLNPEKKQFYYQNRVLEAYKDIIVSQSVDRKKTGEVSKYLSLLRELNMEAYEESLNILLKLNSLMYRD
ncbi:hypothetical protein LAT59_01080, partial [Candidatus Gracilibacteria bacterium]|nr:hypothetical protein [Candidatus Gracilibacteria bacterium]